MRLFAPLSVAAVATTLAISSFVIPASAQDNVITHRKADMKALDDQSAIGAAILKGQAPYNAAKVAAMFQALKGNFEGFTGLFPKGSDTGDTKAAAAIWSDRAGFEKAAAHFQEVVAANAEKAQTEDGFKAAFTAVAGACRACHQSYKNR